MKKLFFLGLVVGLVLVSSSNVYANLITNPGFESGETGWSFFFSTDSAGGHAIQSPGYGSANYGENTVSTLSGVSKDGNTFAGYYQKVTDQTSGAIQPGQLLYLSGDVKAYNLTSSGGIQGQLQVEFYNSYTINSAYRIWGSDIDTAAVSANQDWAHYTAQGYVPAGAKAFQIVTLDTGELDNQTGKFGYDNVNVDYAPVPEPTSLLLLGSGLVGLFGVSRKKK